MGMQDEIDIFQCVNGEIRASFCGERLSKRLSFANFARMGTDQLL